MFKKNSCPYCSEKVSEKHIFCSNCGNKIKDKGKQNSNQNWGMLGINDRVREPELNGIRLPPGFNAIFNTLMKGFENQFKDMDAQLGKGAKMSKNNRAKLPKGVKKGGISINISTSGNKPPEIKVQSFGNMPQFKEKEKQVKTQMKEMPSLVLTETDQKQFTKLPQEEPETNIRRLSNKVVYEIELPGVKSIKNISIARLENSIEIRAISKNKSYFKLISISLPITSYKLSKEKLILELGTEE